MSKQKAAATVGQSEAALEKKRRALLDLCFEEQAKKGYPMFDPRWAFNDAFRELGLGDPQQWTTRMQAEGVIEKHPWKLLFFRKGTLKMGEGKKVNTLLDAFNAKHK